MSLFESFLDKQMSLKENVTLLLEFKTFVSVTNVKQWLQVVYMNFNSFFKFVDHSREMKDKS